VTEFAEVWQSSMVVLALIPNQTLTELKLDHAGTCH
jgi:hypothetical protein